MASDLMKSVSAMLALVGMLAGCSGDSSPVVDRGVNPNRGRPGAGPTGGPSPGVGLPVNPINVDNPTEAVEIPANNTVEEEACGNAQLSANRVLPSVMILLDGSQSMLDPYGDPNAAPTTDGGAPPAPLTRWHAAREALINPVDGVVVQLQELVRFGVAVFGTMPTCPLPMTPIQPELMNFDTIAAAVPMDPPGMFTPTGPALQAVVDLLPDSALALDVTIGPQIIILATDGDPNSCPMQGLFAGIPMTDYAPSIAAAKAAQAKNQRMYVVSVGQDAAAQHLQEMANLGAGMDQFANPGAQVYYPDNPTALADTLAQLIGDELSCEVALSGEGVMEQFRCNGTVTMTIGTESRELECDGADGWKLLDPTHIELQGTACEEFKGAIDAHLDANFPCEFLIK